MTAATASPAAAARATAPATVAPGAPAAGTVEVMAPTSVRARLTSVLGRPRPGQVVWWVVGAVVAVAAFTAAALAA
jgi:hypothetical protein